MTPLRCAFLFGPISTGSRPLDFQTMETNKRGMTGTDNSFCGYAAAMAKRGHEVHVYAEGVEQQTWRVSDDVTVPVYPYAAREGITSYIDAVCSWNDVAGLADAPRTAVRLLDMQVNDFSYLSHSGLLENVDQFVAPSHAELRRRGPVGRLAERLQPGRIRSRREGAWALHLRELP